MYRLLPISCFLILTGTLILKAEEPTGHWFKGNLHTHTFWSDGNDFPEMVAEWYRTHGYHFLALSDHNTLSQGIRWMKYSDIQRRAGGDHALAKYRQTFGDAWVETRGSFEEGTAEVRLKPLNEFRALVEERNRFIMIQGEEVSDSVDRKPIHMNASNLLELIRPVGGKTPAEAIANNLRALQEQQERTGREMMLHVNHPNFGWALTAEDLASVTAERFFEVYNGHPSVNNLGDKLRPGTERLWDIANTLRLGKLGAPVLFGIATDDSHTYHGKPGSHPGRGWVVVRAQYLTPEHLIKALKAGDFYASSGVELTTLKFDTQTNQLHVAARPQSGESFTIEFIGTPVEYDSSTSPRFDAQGKPLAATQKYSADVGQVLKTVQGNEASFQVSSELLYVRAVVTSSLPPADPIQPNQKQKAWTQPVVPAPGD